MTLEQLKKLLSDISSVRIAVLGDFCVDAYWILHPGGSEVSVETGLAAQAVQRQYYNPGGAGNIVANLAALKPARIGILGAVGRDIFGTELRNQLAGLGADTSLLIVQETQFDTFTFAKRYLNGVEQPRIDFGVYNQRSSDTDRRLLNGLQTALATADIVILNQQIPGSLDSPGFIESAREVIGDRGGKVILDSRHYGHRFGRIIRKCNIREAADLNGRTIAESDDIPLTEVESFARRLYQQDGHPVFITMGSRGILVFEQGKAYPIPAIDLGDVPVDPVGAGDTTLAAMALALAAGKAPAEAAEFATFAAAVTVQKLYQTGTANAEEIVDIFIKRRMRA
jgi:rfaE bifunctional protein kinase chain/domain